MFKIANIKSMDDLIDQTIPTSVKNNAPFEVDKPWGNALPKDILHEHFKSIIGKNKRFRTMIGEGFFPTLVPHVIERCFFTNPGWYTPYTPYQAEISQGRLLGLAIYQELIANLTGMEIAGASLLDEASASAEAMIMSWNSSNRKLRRFIVDSNVYSASIKAIITHADHLGIEVIQTKVDSKTNVEGAFGVLFQSPDTLGVISDKTEIIKALRSQNDKLVFTIGTDLASTLI